MSGSFVISGRAVVKLTNVGDESFSAKIMKESKKIKETGKYGDIINTTLEMKAKRQISLYINTWI